MVSELKKKKKKKQLHTCYMHITYFLIFLNIQKIFFDHSGNQPSRTEPDCKQTIGPILGPRQNERLKILLCFPENPHLIKLTHNI